jgi:Fic family protein
MKSLERKYLNNLVLPRNFSSLLRQIGEYKGKQDLYKMQTPDILKNLQKTAKIQSTESSNRIEGITAPHKRIEEIVEHNPKLRNRPEEEIAGYRDVLNTIHENYKHIPLNINIVLQFHRDLMKYTTLIGGTWKATSNEITEILPNGQKIIRFKPIAPFQTANYMHKLQEFHDDAIQTNELDPLIIINLYIFDFLAIHPFLDGNGRMSRLLSTLLLYHYGYEVVRYISLERIIEKTKESYYSSLQTASKNWHEGQHNIVPWLEYMLFVILAAYKEFEERVNFTKSKHGAKTDMVFNTIENHIGDFSVSDIKKSCPTVSTDWIREVLKDLKKQNKIICLGKGRSARWRKLN